MKVKQWVWTCESLDKAVSQIFNPLSQLHKHKVIVQQASLLVDDRNDDNEGKDTKKVMRVYLKFLLCFCLFLVVTIWELVYLDLVLCDFIQYL